MRGWVAASLLLVAGCSRANPSFGLDGGRDGGTAADDGASTADGADDLGDGAASTDGGADGDTSGKEDGVDDALDDGPEDEDEGDSGLDEDDDGPLDSTGAASEGGSETGCDSSSVILAPMMDTFVHEAGPPCLEEPSTQCDEVDFGAVGLFPIEDDLDSFRSYLLVRFDLSDAEAIADLNLQSARLQLGMVGSEEGVTVVVYRFQSVAEWHAGAGEGDAPAEKGAATWQWAARPEPWSLLENNGDVSEGPFDILIEPLEPLAETSVALDSKEPDVISVELPLAEAAEWVGGSVDLAITTTGNEAIAYSMETKLGPRLRLSFSPC